MFFNLFRMFTGDKPVYKRPFGLREEALITQLLFFLLAFLILIIDPSVPLQLIRVIFTGCVVVHKFCVQQPDVIHKKKPWWEILMNEFGSLFLYFFLSEGMPTGFGSELEGRPEILRMDQPLIPGQAPPLNYPADGAAILPADHPIPGEAGEEAEKDGQRGAGPSSCSTDLNLELSLAPPGPTVEDITKELAAFLSSFNNREISKKSLELAIKKLDLPSASPEKLYKIRQFMPDIANRPISAWEAREALLKAIEEWEEGKR